MFLCDWLVCERTQPGAGELLEKLEEHFGWPVRYVFAEAVAALRDDRQLPGYLRDYLRLTLTDENISEALRGGVKKNYEDTATLDKLFQRSAAYRDSAAFREMIEFSARFRAYAPYNNMLVRLQNPSCRYYATERDWVQNFHRTLIQDARPLLILAPMHPVMLVYDLDQTEGPPLPQRLRDFTHTVGELDPDALPRLLENAARDRIKVDFVPLSTTHAGRASTRVRGREWKMRITVNEALPPSAQCNVLCHELAHIYLGHLGGDKQGWWPARLNLTHATVEIEAEAVAYIVSTRLGLRPSSEAYLCTYLRDGSIPPSVSMELITKTAGRIEGMTKHKLPRRKEPGEVAGHA